LLGVCSSKNGRTYATAVFLRTLEDSWRRTFSGSWCNNRADLFEKTPSIFLKILIIPKLMQLCNRRFSKDPKNNFEEILEVQAVATAEHMFSKRPHQHFVGVWSSKNGRNCATGVFKRKLRRFMEEVLQWKLMQQRNRPF
jgi:hypothetical protein